jgi:hypothetical protein
MPLWWLSLAGIGSTGLHHRDAVLARSYAGETLVK